MFSQVIAKMNDLDEEVRQAAQFLDGSLRTSLSNALSTPEGSRFNLREFMNILQAMLKSINPNVKEYLIRWIYYLNEISSVNLLGFLPELLEDLLLNLNSKEKKLVQISKQCLSHFRREMEQRATERATESTFQQETLGRILTTLTRVLKSKPVSVAPKMECLVWLQFYISCFRRETNQLIGGSSKEIGPKMGINGIRDMSVGSKDTPSSNKDVLARPAKPALFRKVVLERFDQLLEPVLLLLSHEDQLVRQAAQATNDNLMSLIEGLNRSSSVNFGKIMPLLKEALSGGKFSSTKSNTALKWMKYMLENHNEKVLPEFHDIMSTLAEDLCDSSVRNIGFIIENTTVHEEYFELLIEKMLTVLVTRCQSEPSMRPLEVMRRFAAILQPEKFCRIFCTKVVTMFREPCRNVIRIIEGFSSLLATQKSMRFLRQRLLSGVNGQPIQDKLFLTIFDALRHNPPSLILLGLLCRRYALCNQIIDHFVETTQPTQCLVLSFCRLGGYLQTSQFMHVRIDMLGLKGQRGLGKKQNGQLANGSHMGNGGNKDDHKNGQIPPSSGSLSSNPLSSNPPNTSDNLIQYEALIEFIRKLLMVLPQGKIYNLIKSRLEVSQLHSNNAIHTNSVANTNTINLVSTTNNKTQQGQQTDSLFRRYLETSKNTQ